MALVLNVVVYALFTVMTASFVRVVGHTSVTVLGAQLAVEITVVAEAGRVARSVTVFISEIRWITVVPGPDSIEVAVDVTNTVTGSIFSVKTIRLTTVVGTTIEAPFSVIVAVSMAVSVAVAVMVS